MEMFVYTVMEGILISGELKCAWMVHGALYATIIGTIWMPASLVDNLDSLLMVCFITNAWKLLLLIFLKFANFAHSRLMLLCN
jgi:hypothetical protein